MSASKEIVNELKDILDHSGNPSQLNQHPWTLSFSVGDMVSHNPALEAQNPGYQLLATLNALFRETMPSYPPRQGKRLDTQWGQFGILGALYFAPFEFNLIRPATLLDGWGRIDEIILRYVFDEQLETLSPDEIARYSLVQDEIEAAPKSTVSGWHVKGLERLTEAFINREQSLSAQLGKPSPILDADQFLKKSGVASPQTQKLQSKWLQPILQFYQQNKKQFWAGLVIILVLLVSLKTWHVMNLYRAFRQDVSQFQEISLGNISLDTLETVGPLLTQTREDVLDLQSQVAPFVWVGGLFGWLPVYGGDLANAEYLLDLAADLVIAGDEGLQVAAPLIESMQISGEMPSIPEVLRVLDEAQPQIEIARQSAEQALIAHAQIDIESLSPKTRPLLEKIDPFLPFLSDGISALIALPKVAGAAAYGPQTYLILLQNEDEIRATGGFITAVGTVTVENGKLISYKVEDSYAVDDFTKLYPRPPWQLHDYMDAPIWVLRDANWSPDFPTTATWVEHLYAYYSAHGVDGVVALDQQAIKMLLSAIGPTQVEGFDIPITAENLIETMRLAKDPSQCSGFDQENRKQCKEFLQPMADAMLTKLQSDSGIEFKDLAQAVLATLSQRHILVTIDDPTASRILANRGWDGALHPGNGDFLMAVNSNIGYNKMDAIVETQLHYAVDLTDLSAPKATLRVRHYNPAAVRSDRSECLHTFLYDASLGYLDLLAQCYWDYFRFYTLADAQLLNATAHDIPGEWLELGKGVPARVDELDNSGIVIENPEGLRAFGTLLVVPWSEERQTSFEYALPITVLAAGERKGDWLYRLHVQKQPGTLAIPLTLQIDLPEGAQIQSVEPDGALQDATATWQATIPLITDVDITLVFSLP